MFGLEDEFISDFGGKVRKKETNRKTRCRSDDVIKFCQFSSFRTYESLWFP
jgi:hypothetical protein